MLLTDRERAEAVADVARLILASGQTAKVQRMVPGERLYGSDDATYSDIAVIPLELDETPPEELSGKIDAVANVLCAAQPCTNHHALKSMPVWFKNSSAAKRPKIHHDFGKNHGKSHPRQAKTHSRNVASTA